MDHIRKPKKLLSEFVSEWVTKGQHVHEGHSVLKRDIWSRWNRTLYTTPALRHVNCISFHCVPFPIISLVLTLFMLEIFIKIIYLHCIVKLLISVIFILYINQKSVWYVYIINIYKYIYYIYNIDYEIYLSFCCSLVFLLFVLIDRFNLSTCYYPPPLTKKMKNLISQNTSNNNGNEK